MKYYWGSNRKFVLFVLLFCIMTFLLYGCGGRNITNDILINESEKKYEITNVNHDGSLYYTSGNTGNNISVTASPGTLPAGSEVYMVERKLYSNEVSIYGKDATPVITLSASKLESGNNTPISETSKPITIVIPNTFSKEYTEFYLAYRPAESTIWQFKELHDFSEIVVDSARLMIIPSHFVIQTYRLNYVFTVFGVKPSSSPLDSIRETIFTAYPTEYLADTDSNRIKCFAEDLVIASNFKSKNGTSIYSGAKVEHELSFFNDNSSAVSFKIDGKNIRDNVAKTPSSGDKYQHKILIDSYLPENIQISADLATYSFNLNLKNIPLSEFSDNFRVKSTFITGSGAAFSEEKSISRVLLEKSYDEPVVASRTIKLVLKSPENLNAVATSSSIIFTCKDEFSWSEIDDLCINIKNAKTGHQILFTSNKNLADGSLKLILGQSLDYDTEYTITLSNEQLSDKSIITYLEPAVYNIKTITPESPFVTAKITADDSFILNGRYKYSPVFYVDFKKQVKSKESAIASLKVTQDDLPVPFICEFSEDLKTAKIVFESGILRANTTYKISMGDSIKDAENLDIYSFGNLEFTTLPGIDVIVKTPEAMTNVSVDSNIVLAFSSEIDWNEDKKSLITITNNQNQEIDWTYVYNATLKELVISHDGVSLKYNTIYTVSIFEGLENKATDQKVEPKNFHLTTGDGIHANSIIKVSDDCVVDDSVYPPVYDLNSTFYIYFGREPSNLQKAVESIKISDGKEEYKLEHYEWEGATLTIKLPINLPGEEIITISLTDVIRDADNVIINNFQPLVYKTSVYAKKIINDEVVYLVRTPKQLDSIRNYRDCFFEQVNDIDMAEYVKTVYGEQGFAPIGNYSEEPFTGQYMGNGYVITGLNINRPNDLIVGLFGFTYGAELIGINLVPKNDEKMIGYGYIGGIAGVAYNTKIEFCSNAMPLSSTKPCKDEETGFFGGICGRCDGNMIISKCKNTGTIDARNAIGAGGILGIIMKDRYSSFTTLEMDSCINNGTIISSICSGGIAGMVYVDSGSINSCYSIADCITSRETPGEYYICAIATSNSNCSAVNNFTTKATTLNGNNCTGAISELFFDPELMTEFDTNNYVLDNALAITVKAQEWTEIATWNNPKIWTWGIDGKPELVMDFTDEL